MKPPKSVVIPIETYRAQPSHPACILLTPMSHDAYCVITPARVIISQTQSFRFHVTWSRQMNRRWQVPWSTFCSFCRRYLQYRTIWLWCMCFLNSNKRDIGRLAKASVRPRYGHQPVNSRLAAGQWPLWKFLLVARLWSGHMLMRWPYRGRVMLVSRAD